MIKIIELYDQFMTETSTELKERLNKEQTRAYFKLEDKYNKLKQKTKECQDLIIKDVVRRRNTLYDLNRMEECSQVEEIHKIIIERFGGGSL